MRDMTVASLASPRAVPAPAPVRGTVAPAALRPVVHPASSPERVLVPDLLHATPLRRIDTEQTKLAIALAFASGVTGGVFAEALEHATFAPTTWDPASFAHDLFLSDFVTRCWRVAVDGRALQASTTHIARVLAAPPADPASVEHRRQVLSELTTTPLLRKELERLYLLLCRFRSLLEGSIASAKLDPNRRQLDILQTFKEIVDCAAVGFASARSGLARLATFGLRVREGEPYRSLADLLSYDERLATLSLTVGIGADGRIRGFEIHAIREETKNPFVSSPVRRWLGKLELFLRGFKFSDGEVMARLIDAVFDGVQDDLVPLVQLLGDVEVYLGALGFADAAEAAGLAVSLPELVPADAPRALHGLFNPLLLAHGVRPVPCDLASDRHDTTVLITGPNSGGKTRLIQSIGLTQLLAQSGMFVPARAGRVALVPGLVMSLIEETRADQSEGRLGTELMRIRALFEKLPPGAMVILDELCSGTNPSEGEEIFELVVQMLSRLGPQAFITTHFLAFANRLERQRKIAELRFLQVELGPSERPTYQFVPGVAQTSLAAHAAARLGVTRDQLEALIDRNAAHAQRRAT